MTKKLIIIDDSATQLSILKTAFINDGWEVCAVQNAKIGLETIFNFAPDLIITDAIMPLMGGFQLMKIIRQDKNINQIPVIVYSILNEANAKFYIKEELSEYFLRKNNNQDELLSKANNIIQKFPLTEEYKNKIFQIGMQNFTPLLSEQDTQIDALDKKNSSEEENIKNATPIEINIDDFAKKIKENNDFSLENEQFFSKTLNILHGFFEYDLGIINTYSNKNNINKVYFDIKNIILSPIFTKTILDKFNTKENVMLKKYAPNLSTITLETEFQSKIEFNFDYEEKTIGNIILYSQTHSKWENIDFEQIKKILFRFFKTKYLTNTTLTTKKEEIAEKYSSYRKFREIKNEKNIYFGLIQILNFSDFETNSTSDEIDMLTSKISEKIINCLEKDEQAHKNELDEYDIVLFAKDKKQLKYRLEYISDAINSISLNQYNINSTIIALNCTNANTLDVIEAHKRTREILETINEHEKVVIYDI